MHVASLHVFDLPAGYRGDFYAKVKRQMAQRLHLAPVLTRKLAPMPLQFANPVWIEDGEVNLDYHVQRITLPSPGTQAQLEDCAARLHSSTLDRNRPLWRLAVIDGLETGQAGYYFQVHHAVLDGQAGVLLANALFDATPQQPRRVRRGPVPRAEHPGIVELAAAALKHDAGQYVKLLRHLPDVVKTLAGMLGAAADGTKGRLGQNFSFGPKTPLNVSVTGERGFAAATIALPTLERLAAVHEAKLNDIVLALCSGALRRYLAPHGGIPKQPLIATMPISLREAGNTEYTTQATLSLVNLHTHIADPVKRLRAIRDGAGAVKSLAKRARGVIPTDFPSIGTPWLLRSLAALYGRSGNRERDAADRQRGDLQRSRTAGSAVCSGRANGRLLAAVDRRAWRRAQHHRVELRGQDGLRLHDRAQRGAGRTRTVSGARGGVGRIGEGKRRRYAQDPGTRLTSSPLRAGRLRCINDPGVIGPQHS